MQTISRTPYSRKASSERLTDNDTRPARARAKSIRASLDRFSKTAHTRPFTLVDYLWFVGGFVGIYGTIAGLLWIGG